MTRFGRAILAVGVVLFIWLALRLLLLLFAGILLAIVLRTLATALARSIRVAPGPALALVLLFLLSAAVLAGSLYAPSLAEQSDQLAESIPAAWSDLTSWLRQYGWGQWILDNTADNAEQVFGQATTMASRVVDAVVAIAVVLFTGLYLAAEPRPYVRGVLRLVPLPERRRFAETIYALGYVLRWWLIGQGLSMLVVGLAMGIGLGILGVQLAFLLGVLAGLFEFVPIIGPMLAVGPALLLALADSTQLALYVLILYSIVQTIEAYVLTPLVQRKVVKLPPVVTIASQVALSWLAGPIGLLVAVPLTAAMMVATQMLYVGDVLGDRVIAEIEAIAKDEVAEEETRTLKGVLGGERS